MTDTSFLGSKLLVVSSSLCLAHTMYVLTAVLTASAKTARSSMMKVFFCLAHLLKVFLANLPLT